MLSQLINPRQLFTHVGELLDQVVVLQKNGACTGI